MARQNLQRVLCQYITDTFDHIYTVKGFCDSLSTWMGARKRELMKMNNKINQGGLAAVLKDTLGGLEKLDYFLDAVEKLAVTSLHVFMEENQVLHLPKGINLELVQVVITCARLVCPLLLEFKRDASVFFLPKLQNVEVLKYQLDKYIQTTQRICETLEKSCFSEFFLKMSKYVVVDLRVGLSEDDIQRMLCQINRLSEIKTDRDFQMVFLFQEVSCSGFISEFSKRQPRMRKFLNELEDCAVQLDRMNKGAKISSVAGSSVGAVSSVLSIVGLALIPFTAGVSLGLIISGTALGITSGVNSAVTTATEIGVNHKHQKKASEVFKSFMEDVQSLQDCLDEVTGQPSPKMEPIQLKADYLMKLSVLAKASLSVGNEINSLVKNVSDAKLLKNNSLIGRVAVQEGEAIHNVYRGGSDIPDIGQVAAKGSLGLSKSARAGLIAVNALFLGMDIFCICKDSIDLAKGIETELSQLIRARSALWSSEMSSWQKIHDSLCKGQLTSEKHKTVLETQFYPEKKGLV